MMEDAATVDIQGPGRIAMGILDGDGFSLPLAMDNEVVEASIVFTESATLAISQSMGNDSETHVLIISVQSGGCSGYLYEMNIIEKPEDGSFQTFDVNGTKVVIHNKDSSVLDGITVDFKNTLMGGGFQIINPNADKTCGCGQSFG